MQAWRLIDANEPLKLMDVPDPVAGPNEVVIDVKAAGICHTDVGYLDGTLTGILGFSPITLGHEIAGVVAEMAPLHGWGVNPYNGMFPELSAAAGPDTGGIVREGVHSHADYARLGSDNQLRMSGYNLAAVVAGLSDNQVLAPPPAPPVAPPTPPLIPGVPFR